MKKEIINEGLKERANAEYIFEICKALLRKGKFEVCQFGGEEFVTIWPGDYNMMYDHLGVFLGVNDGRNSEIKTISNKDIKAASIILRILPSLRYKKDGAMLYKLFTMNFHLAMHEITHAIDFDRYPDSYIAKMLKRMSDILPDVSTDDKKYKEYLNNPMEFNGWYEMTFSQLKMAARLSRSYPVEKRRLHFPESFPVFVTTVLPQFQFISKYNKKYYRKFVKKLSKDYPQILRIAYGK